MGNVLILSPIGTSSLLNNFNTRNNNMKTVTTLVLFASLMNIANFLDKYTTELNYVEHKYEYTVPTVRYEIAVKPKSFKGNRAPAIVSNR
jgi:hypothetical protein